MTRGALLAAAIALTAASCAAPKTVERKVEPRPIVIVVAGQSNASARSDWPSCTLTGRVSVNRDVFPNPGEVETIAKTAELPMLGPDIIPDIDHPTFHSLPFLYLGDLLAEATGRPVRIVNVSIGGTVSAEWAAHLGDVLAEAVAREHPDFVLFAQGESDRGNSGETYYQNIKFMLEKLKFSRAPFFLATTTWFDHGGGVHEAQMRLIREGLVRRGVDLDALRLEQPAPTPWDRLHLDEQRMLRHGEEWFRLLYPLL